MEPPTFGAFNEGVGRSPQPSVIPGDDDLVVIPIP